MARPANLTAALPSSLATGGAGTSAAFGGSPGPTRPAPASSATPPAYSPPTMKPSPPGIASTLGPAATPGLSHGLPPAPCALHVTNRTFTFTFASSERGQWRSKGKQEEGEDMAQKL